MKRKKLTAQLVRFGSRFGIINYTTWRALHCLYKCKTTFILYPTVAVKVMIVWNNATTSATSAFLPYRSLPIPEYSTTTSRTKSFNGLFYWPNPLKATLLNDSIPSPKLLVLVLSTWNQFLLGLLQLITCHGLSPFPLSPTCRNRLRALRKYLKNPPPLPLIQVYLLPPPSNAQPNSTHLLFSVFSSTPASLITLLPVPFWRQTIALYFGFYHSYLLRSSELVRPPPRETLLFALSLIFANVSLPVVD